MEKFIPYEKLSKKEKRKIDQARRQTWGELNPVTRKPENSKAYNRNKARNWKRDYHEPVPGLLLCIDCRQFSAVSHTNKLKKIELCDILSLSVWQDLGLVFRKH